MNISYIIFEPKGEPKGSCTGNMHLNKQNPPENYRKSGQEANRGTRSAEKNESEKDNRVDGEENPKS